MVSDIEDLHTAACRSGQPFYIDPATKYYVFTSEYLSKRPCCGCGCRHCPYTLKKRVSRPRLLYGEMDSLSENLDVLFWSGGKDSYLALRRLRKEGRDVLLLTTFDEETRMVAHQNVAIEQIKRQAEAIGLPLMGVPVAGGEYVQCCNEAIKKLGDEGVTVSRVAFGDLHLNHIRQWRETQLDSLGQLYYPVWRVPYHQLLQELWDAHVAIKVTAVEDSVEGVSVGDVFNQEFVSRLPEGVDVFGENGEFHTIVELWKGEKI